MVRAAIRNLNTPINRNTISFQHLRYAVVAADHGSFRSAAETLMVQQTTLSRCIRQLEHTIGTPVFDRYSGGVRATRFGQSFLRIARSILEQVDNMVTSAQMTGRGEFGPLSIGFYTSLSAGNLRAGDVPLFVEHCEAAAAEVDVTRRWLDQQGRRELSFSFDVLAERYGVPEVACAPSIVGSLLRLPAWPPRSSAGPSRPIAIASRCGRRDARCS